MTAKQPDPASRRLVCLFVFVMLCGCSNSAAPPTPTDTPAETSADNFPADSASADSVPVPQASDLLEKMRGVYRNAKSYTENASVVFYAVLRTTGGEVATPFTRSSVAFERPNRLHVTYHKDIASPQEERYEIVSNGAIIRSTADEVPLQIHEAIAPLELSTENFIPESVLRGTVLVNTIENTFPSLALLLEGDQQQVIFSGEDQARVLQEAELDGKTYFRVALPTPAGDRVLWIDQNEFTLRRMEVPIDNQRPLYNAHNQYSKVSVWVDFEEVTIDPEIDSATFDLAIPENARRVRRFIRHPPAGPPEMFGKTVEEFAFTSMEGEAVTPATLAGKVAVLDFWSTNCPACKSQSPVMNEVYQEFKNSEDVAFFAVSTDRSVVPNDVVAKTLLSWGGKMPILRDLESSGYQTPTLMLIDRESRLQTLQIGTHKNSGPVINAIQRLVEGEDVVAADRKKHAEYVVKYEQALDAATIADSIVTDRNARPEVAPRQYPEKIDLKQLWQTSSEQIKRPGDVQLTGDRLLVLDGGEAIVEMSLRGETVGRHQLPQHDEQTDGFLRSWTSAKGDCWTLASGVGWQQVYVFDNHWKMVLAFPDERHSGIGDVLFDDLTGSGTPVMHVGYWGGLGVQGGALDGRQLWSNPLYDHVLQIGRGPAASENQPAAASGERTAWCSSTRGMLLQLGADGKAIRERYIEGQALMYFASLPSSDSQASGDRHCGLAVGLAGQYTAVGFDSLGTVTWEYPLPHGEYAEQLPRVQSVVMPKGEKAWLVVAANGSLHWLSTTGELIDRFVYGEILTGVVMQSIGDETLLYVATAKDLTSWHLSSPSQASEDSEPSEDVEPSEDLE